MGASGLNLISGLGSSKRGKNESYKMNCSLPNSKTIILVDAIILLASAQN